ncbi:MAG: cytidylate kinase family protein [Nitrospirae bacterium]|nr:cytidylate kinase family protein [Nitrospirota bacterium]
MAIVAITRQAGSGGEEIGKGVAGKLGYDYVGKERTFAELEKRGKKWLSWGRNLDEHCPTLWEHFDPSFAGFVSLVEEIIYDCALKDNVVIMGRGAHRLLKDIPYALRVLTMAPVETRVKRISDREHVNLEAAERLVQFSDHERSCYIHTVYQRDWTSLDDYDMMFDTGRLGFEEVVKAILDEIPERERQATEDAREKLRRLALAARVKAHVASDLRFFVPTLEVFHDGTRIVIRGVVHSVKEHKLVEDLAKEVAAPTQVRCELHYRS